ncbi:MAG: hypothetical protein FJW35_13405, partial [Acidobacteria bacterium]|nr:hypothetical protein [Acidobacteriota bacterium]
MTRSQTNPRITANRKKRSVPLSKLRTSEVVRAVVNHPRRLEELVGLLEDKDVAVRGRAATTLVRLADSHPERLLRMAERLKGGLADESAFVRWHLVYVLGRLGWNFPARAASFLPRLADCLDDGNGVVRSL